jgi:hypothetical protein
MESNKPPNSILSTGRYSKIERRPSLSIDPFRFHEKVIYVSKFIFI